MLKVPRKSKLKARRRNSNFDVEACVNVLARTQLTSHEKEDGFKY